MNVGAKTANGAPVRPDFQTKLIGSVIGMVFLGSIAWIGSKVTDVADRITRLEVIVEKNWESRQSWETRWEQRFNRLEQSISEKLKSAGNGK